MDERAKSSMAAEIEAAFAWWRDAGVDGDFHDEPANWLTDAAPAASAGDGRSEPEVPALAASDIRSRTPAPAQAPAFERAALPGDIESFTAWWLAEPALDDGRTSGRVPPRGIPGAALMIVVPEPEREDGERLLSGPQGRLLDAMLSAMGIPTELAYVASALPRHTPMADWSAMAALGIGEVLRHHIGLATPRRVLVLGGTILPLLGHDPAQNRADLLEIQQDGVTIPVLAGKSLAALLERPRWKAGLWQAWLDWMSR